MKNNLKDERQDGVKEESITKFYKKEEILGQSKHNYSLEGLLYS